MKPIVINSREDVPRPMFKPGERVRIPRGTLVRSMHPKRKQYMTARQQRITVNHMLSGRYVSVGDALGQYKTCLEQQGFDLTELQQWQRSNALEFYVMLVQLDPPAVRWAGSGGYWCEVPASQVDHIG